MTTSELHEVLWDIARGLNRYVQAGMNWDRPPERNGNNGKAAGNRPGDDFNRRAEWREILEPHGWEAVGRSGDTVYWRRPGKSGRVWSATTGHCRGDDSGDLLYVFTSSAPPFEPERCYSRFAAFALLNHNGDCKAAARTLGQQGYGDRKMPSGDRNGHHAAPNGNGNGHQRQQTGTQANGHGPAASGVSGNNSTNEPARLAMTCLDTVRIRPLRWLIPNYLPAGKLALLAGDGGWGKSTVTLDVMACMTTGRPCFGLNYTPLPACDVLLISCEDDWEDTIVPRLAAAGADLSRIHRVDGVESKAVDGDPVPFSLVHYREASRTLREHPGIRLVVIDPAGAYIGRSGIDDHKDSELRSLLGPMTDVAGERNVTFLLVKHLNRNAQASAVHRVMGSAGYVNAVRMALIIAPDKDDEDLRYLLPIKANIARKASGRTYKITGLTPEQQVAVLERHGDHLSAEDGLELASQLIRVQWVGNADKTPDELLSAPKTDRAGRLKDAVAWLEGFLAEFAYPSSEVFDAGEEAGFSRPLLFAAKKALTGKVNARSTGFQGVWHWGLGNSNEWTVRPQSVQSVQSVTGENEPLHLEPEPQEM